MSITTSMRARAGAAALVVSALAGAACSVEKQVAPTATGPSEFALSVTLAAAPDIVPRDGTSVSVVTLRARDHQGQPVSGRRLILSRDPLAGTLSANEVVTDANGTATVRFTAPPVEENVDVVRVFATPVGENFANSTDRNVAIRVAGPAFPVPSFTFAPTAPKQFEATTFDASATRLNGTLCRDNCFFSWSFGGGGGTFGSIVTHRFQNAGAHVVTLTATTVSGTSETTSRTVLVTAVKGPTADFDFLPSAPQPYEPVVFNGSKSKGGEEGVTILDYEWNFGNGVIAFGQAPTVTYSEERAFAVTLTVTDSNGLSASTTKLVNVKVSATP